MNEYSYITIKIYLQNQVEDGMTSARWQNVKLQDLN